MATIEPAAVSVAHAILHLLDPEDAGFRPSLRALPNLAGSIGTFLAEHIAHSMSDAKIKGARFLAFGADQAPGLLQRLVDNCDFEADSQALAKVAYDIMAADRRIRPPGSLAVLRYAVAPQPDNFSVAVLKLDKGGRFRWVERADATGSTYWDLEEASDVAPSSGERLHKAAFVGKLDPAMLAGLGQPTAAPLPDGLQHHFLVLDRQVRPGADWWLSKFLLAEPASTDEDRALSWYKGALAGKRRVQDRLDEEARAALDLAIRSGITSSTVKVNEWVEALDVPAPLKAEVRAEIDNRVAENEISIPNSVRQKLAKAAWEGDYGLRVTIDADYADHVQATPVDGGWDVTIRTSRWTQVR